MSGGAIAAQGPSDAVLTPELIRTVFEVEPIFLTDPSGQGVHLAFD